MQLVHSGVNKPIAHQCLAGHGPARHSRTVGLFRPRCTSDLHSWLVSFSETTIAWILIWFIKFLFEDLIIKKKLEEWIRDFLNHPKI